MPKFYSDITVPQGTKVDISSSEWVKDEDNMSSASASHLATQQSIKAYVDANAGGVSLTNDGDDRIVTATGSGGIRGETYAAFQNSGNSSTLTLMSNQDTSDKFQITTTTSGATTIRTIDNGGDSADIQVTADGDITLSNAFVDLSLSDRSIVADGQLEAKSITHEIPGTTIGNVGLGAEIVYFGGTLSMTTGHCYYLNASGTWSPTNAGTEADASGLLAIALGASSNANGMLLRGMVAVDAAGTHDYGKKVYLRAQNGVVTTDAPTTGGDIVRIIGYMLHDSNDAIFFCPDNTFVEVAT
jgi:hypothetical protein